MTTYRRTKLEMMDLKARLYDIAFELRPATVRQIFYQCTVRGICTKDEASYGRIARVLADMRKEGSLPYKYLADATRWQRRPRSHDSLADAIEATAAFYRRDALTRSDRYVEVWLEKDALSGVVYDVTKEFDVPLMVARGFASLSFLYSAAEEIREEDRPTTIYHLGDWDPSGQQAARSTRDSLYELSQRDDLEFVQLAVLPEQIEEWQLPTRPTKREGNAHAKNWRGDSVELDAIHPNTLRQLVREALWAHIPEDELDVLRTVEEEERAALKLFSRRLAFYDGEDRAIRALRTLAKRANNITEMVHAMYYENEDEE